MVAAPVAHHSRRLHTLYFVRERPEEVGQVADGFGPPLAAGQAAPDTRPAFVSRREWTFCEAVREPGYWLLLVSLLGSSGGYTLFLAHGVLHLQDLGHSARIGAWAVSIMTVSGLIGKAILAVFGDRIDPRYIYASFVAAFGVGIVVIVNAHALWQVVLFAVCIGIGYAVNFYFLAVWCFVGSIVLFLMRRPETTVRRG